MGNVCFCVVSSSMNFYFTVVVNQIAVNRTIFYNYNCRFSINPRHKANRVILVFSAATGS